MRIRHITIDEGAADVLRRSTLAGNILTLPEQLDRALYVKTDKALKALGGKWDRRAGGHVFPLDVSTELAAALDAGKVVDRKKTLELFETPQDIAGRMADIAMAHMGPTRRLLEPSAGRGRLLAAMARRITPQAFDDIIAIDIDAANCEALRQQGIATVIACTDFITQAPSDILPDVRADVILMNPPFAATADILHVTHAFTRWLAPGGILVAIMSPHFTFAEDRASTGFRALLRDHGGDWERLPDNSFRAEGTNVSTVLVTMRRAA